MLFDTRLEYKFIYSIKTKWGNTISQILMNILNSKLENTKRNIINNK